MDARSAPQSLTELTFAPGMPKLLHVSKKLLRKHFQGMPRMYRQCRGGIYSMFNRTKRLGRVSLLSAMVILAGASAAFGQSGSTKDRWLHVRVINSDNKGETVRVNIPLELAENVLPTINKNHLHNGKVTIDQAHMNDVDVRALLNAIRTATDGEYVTVQGPVQDGPVAKGGARLRVVAKEKKVSNSTNPK